MILEEFSAWFVWVIPLIASCFVPVIGKYSEKARNYFVIAISAISGILALSLVPSVWNNPTATYYQVPWLTGGITAGVYVDPLSVLFACLVAFFALVIAVYSQGYMKGEEGLTRYYYLLLLFIGSMIGLVLSDNMLQMFIFWEMVGLCSYALISFWYKKPESIHSGVKVFIMTRIGDIMLLAAIGILYFLFNTFSFSTIISQLPVIAETQTGLLVIAAFLILGGAVAKSAQFPLFTWLYSAMEAPTSVSALLHAATMVKAGIYLLSRFILIFSVAPVLIEALQVAWFPTVTWIGVITAFIGATLGLMTTDIKGVLAYSTVSQIGFMMAGLGAAVEGAASIGWFASLFHMVSHAFFEGLGFLLAGGIIHALGTRDMRLMGGLRKAMPITFGLMFVMIITTSGIPPFAAFFSKGLILTSVSELGTTAGLIQTIVLYASAAITFAYCVRMFSLVFMGKPSEHLEKQHVHEAPKVMLIPAAVLAVLCIVWGLSEPAVLSFMGLALEHVSLLGAFLTYEFPLFMALLLPVFLLGYWTYYKDFQGLRKIAAGNNPLTALLNHKYFIDDFYYAIGRGITGFSNLLTRFENAVFANAPDKAGVDIGRAAEPGQAMALKKGPSDSFRNYVAAAVVGFIIIMVLILLTVGFGGA
ncbi:MAG: NADH-quinone oxidoreductase subunit L [Candidatus Bathyarchaeia archaeon]|jgi:NADH-quinone oxidoreductase subunit L